MNKTVVETKNQASATADKSAQMSRKSFFIAEKALKRAGWEKLLSITWEPGVGIAYGTKFTRGAESFWLNKDTIGARAFQTAIFGMSKEDAATLVQHNTRQIIQPGETWFDVACRLQSQRDELLEELKKLVGIICSLPGYKECDVNIEDCDSSKVAIAKAEGQ